MGRIPVRGVVWMALAVGVLALPTPAQAALSLPDGFASTTLTPDVTLPVAVAWTPDGRMLIAERHGIVRVMDPDGTLEPNPVLNIQSDVSTYWDRGMLGIAVDADYTNNHYIYLLYTHQTDPANAGVPTGSQLRRVVLNPDNSVGEQKVILGTQATGACPPPSNTSDCIPSNVGEHSVGTVRADPDGTLWVGNGDDADAGGVDSGAFRALDETSFAGKVIHIDRQGNGLPGHPFCPTDTDLTHVCTKIYAKGLRNPFRFTLRPGGGGPAVGDLGWNTWEELDLLQPGGDYGWPCWEANTHTPGYSDDARCSGPGGEYSQTTQPPAFAWSRSQGSIAIMGGPTYTGDKYPGAFHGAILFGDYGSGVLHRFDPVTGTATQWGTGAVGWVDLESAPAGLSYADPGDLIYALPDFQTGTGIIGRILYTTGNRPPTAVASATPSTGDPPLTVQFDGSGSTDPDSDPLTYSWDFGDGTTGTGATPPPHTYSQRGRYTAKLTVSDGSLQASTTKVISVGAPTVTISTPTAATLYQDGVAVPLQGSATDATGQAVPDSGLSWHVILHHETHIHDLGLIAGGSTSFTPLTSHDSNSYYDVTLTATDSAGISGGRTVSIHPQTVGFRVDSNPPGAPISYAGTAQTTPFATQSAVGFQTSVSAATAFSVNGTTYTFASWSDGGARLHDLTVPAQDVHLTATYVAPPVGLPGPATQPVFPAQSPSTPSVLRITFVPTRRMAENGRLTGHVRSTAGVRTVEVAIRSYRRGRAPCRWWSPRTQKLRTAACARPAWIRARLKPSTSRTGPITWSASLGGRLPKGRYVLLTRAFDRRGDVGYHTRLTLKV